MPVQHVDDPASIVRRLDLLEKAQDHGVGFSVANNFTKRLRLFYVH